MSDIMAVMDQKDNYDISFVVQRQSPWSGQYVRPGISQLQYTMADVSVVQVVQVLFPQRCAEAVSMVQTVRLTMDILCCST